MKSIISFLTFIVEGIARAVVFLLSTLGLWIPALFCALFFLVCAITVTPFADVAGIFYVGLALSMLLSIGISVAQVLKKKDIKRLSRSADKPKKLKKKKGEEQQAPQSDFAQPNMIYPNDGYQPQPGYPQPGYPYQPQPGYSYQPYGYQTQYPYPQPGYQPPYQPQQPYPAQPTYPQQPYQPQQNYQPQQPYSQPQQNYQPQQPYSQPQSYPQRQNDMQGGGNNFASYQNDENKQDSGSAYEQAKKSMNREFFGYDSPGKKDDTPSYNDLKPKESAFNTFNEQPLGVYRTRVDPDVVIYEYADRIEYYRRNDRGGLDYVRTQSKR
ncbi:MAG: hypothetical protein PUH99_02265 [Firmicutes bacterium]|nr:hypothetical protein [Bacillota bacterium]MDY5531447.1 hypothetical protein [Pumilibacteraceae bacterium]